jgi:Zn-finger protein
MLKIVDTKLNEDEEIICNCGNSPSQQGFYPCDENGNDVEPVKGWKGLYKCDNCGLIHHVVD